MIPFFDEQGKFHVSHFRLGYEPRFVSTNVEPLGSKPKVWIYFLNEPLPWLFKFARPGTGEHWAEKLGCEIAQLLSVPAARAELADSDGHPGILVESIVPHAWDDTLMQPVPQGDLIHGNEVLEGCVKSYDKDGHWGQIQHSYINIVEGIGNAVPFEQVTAVMREFAGLLVLDAVIGNQDRHHENWALLRTVTSEGETITLAPSYDHASSLGRELRDERRLQYISENRIARYIQRGHGAIWGQSTGQHADNPIALVRWASAEQPDLFSPWLERVRQIADADIIKLLDKMPPSVMGQPAREFCYAFLTNTIEELRGITA